MLSSGSSKNKVLVATAALLGVVWMNTFFGLSVTTASRVTLGVALLGALFILGKGGKEGAHAATPSARLKLLSQVGLSRGCRASLLEADGQTYMVIHGEGHAQILSTKNLSHENLTSTEKRFPSLPAREKVIS